MPSTARLLTAIGTDKIHAHAPGEDTTLCHLSVVDPEDWEETPPSRSADFTGRRFYDGIHRQICQTCRREAIKVRVVAQGVPLQEVRAG